MFLFLSKLITPRHEHRILAFVLITLHFTLWWNYALWWAHFTLILHFILFILWQPLWSKREPPTLKSNLLFIISGLIFVIFLNIWLLTLWQIILIGLLSGHDLVKPHDRFANLTALTFLILDLLLLNVHQLFILGEFTTTNWLIFDSHWLLQYGLLILPLSLLFISTDDSLEYRYYIDFFQGLTFALLTIIIVLGSLIVMSYGQVNYPFAVFSMSLVVALFVLFISWIWLTSIGEDSVDQLWTKHLFNMGHSLEQWLDNLAQPDNYKSLSPKEFLNNGFAQLITLPWVTGIAWRSLYGEDMRGEEDREHAIFSVQSVEVTIFSHYRISGGHYFFIKVLVQLLEYFHQAKRREEAFAQQAHLQAIHETGAKLTHDIKNLLQSLHAIASAIETCEPAQFGDTQRLLQHQMPHLTQRLKRTLDKLQKPAELSYTNVPISLWWENLRARYAKRNIEFFKTMEIENALVPEDLFDNVMENLLQNVLMKRKREPKLQIEVSLHIDKKRAICLTVCDDGTAVPEDIARNLLVQPVASRDGFGIGLYQAAKQIAHTGYGLSLKENQPGQVCFELASVE